MKKIHICCYLLLMNSVYSDDSSFGGEGATPFPINEPDIRMVDEKIVINGQDLNREDFRGTWDYSCDFTFKNTTDKSISIRMGFPFPINNEFDNIMVPAGYTVKNGSALVYNFAATLDGQPLEVTHSKIKENEVKGLSYNDAYLWNMTFSPNQEVKIHHRYLTGVTIDSMGYSWVYYVLKTGGLWHDGNIGEAKLYVIPNTPTRLCAELDNLNADYLKPTPPGLKISGEGKNRQYSWDLTNFHPNDDVSLCLQTGRNYVRYSIVYKILSEEDIADNKFTKMNAEQLRIIRNSIYAQYGRPFESTELQSYFDKQWWYEKNESYSDALLTKDDLKALDIIKKYE